MALPQREGFQPRPLAGAKCWHTKGRCPELAAELFTWFIDSVRNLKGGVPSLLFLDVAEEHQLVQRARDVIESGDQCDLEDLGW